MDAFALNLETEEVDNVVNTTTVVSDFVNDVNNGSINKFYVQFENDSSALTSESYQRLIDWWNQLGVILQGKIGEENAEIILEGYSSPKGSHEYNAQLADQRISTIKKVLHRAIGKNVNELNVFVVRVIGEATGDAARVVTIEFKEK